MRTIDLAIGDTRHSIEVGDDGLCEVAGHGNSLHVTRLDRFTFRVDQDPPDGSSTRVSVVETDGRLWTFVDGEVYEIERLTASRGRAAAVHRPDPLQAPMPATVARILVSVGQDVEVGDPLVLLEAMKMELPLIAPVSGVVEQLACREGELVEPGHPLVRLRPRDQV